ncbi:hypothetical protein [Litorimonas sp. WD9-15]|uniref:hypothetical protein n=1 Tax=Litorimonas sp. WD9-15 TaxID=3418716 RepID=UPI003CFCA345
MSSDAKFDQYIVAHVRDGETLDALVQALETGGFDRAQLSVLSREGTSDPFNHESEAVEKPDDRQQFRVLVTSFSAAVAGMAGAGLAAAITGGMAIPAIITGAVAAGGVATVSETLGVNYAKGHEEWIHRQMAMGGVLLNIFPRTAQEGQKAVELSRKYCGNAILHSYDED